MKRILISLSVACAVATSILFTQTATGSAQDIVYDHLVRHHRHHNIQTAYLLPSDELGNCRIGWWQTLRYGHVHPRWAVWCR
jgi:hypothetical protein